jgi:diaminopimelate epimerase
MLIEVAKAHAYGNDFLFVPVEQTAAEQRSDLARRMCDRHAGIGADGLVLYAPTDDGAEMTLFNADGGEAEVSGNAVRCLAALAVRERPELTNLIVRTAAGAIPLRVIERTEQQMTLEALMGAPTGLRQRTLEAAGELVEVVQLSVGNPQCIVLRGPDRPVNEATLHRLGPALATHSAFPAGSNVELVEVESASRIRILIWERGVGPTEASGTGACASAVAAAAFGGASRDVDVVSPGGTQHVSWASDGIRLTGWARVVMTGHWHT